MRLGIKTLVALDARVRNCVFEMLAPLPIVSRFGVLLVSIL